MTQVKVTYDALKEASIAIMDVYEIKHGLKSSPSMITFINQMIHDIIQTVLKKNADYGDAWQRYGMFTGLIRLNDKLLRVQTLADGRPALVADEGIGDTLVDIVGYGLLLKVWLDGQESFKGNVEQVKTYDHSLSPSEIVERSEQLHFPFMTEEELKLKAIASEDVHDNRIYEDELEWCGDPNLDLGQFARISNGHLITRDDINWRADKNGRHFIYETDLDIKWEPKPSNRQE